MKEKRGNMAQNNTSRHERRLKESTEKSWSLMKSQHKASMHVGNSGDWSKMVWMVISQTDQSFNEEKIKLNGYFGKKCNDWL